MKMKRSFLLILAACLLLVGVQSAGAEHVPSLKEIYAGKFDFGAAAPRAAFENAKLRELIREQFSILTPENELKPNYVIDWPESKKKVRETGDETAVAVHLDSARPLLNFAKENGIKVHGHVLVWHIETREEFFHEGYDAAAPLLDRKKMLGRLENYIMGLMALLENEYPGLVVSWDVVNEAIDDGSHSLRKSNWFDTVGEDYVERAFELARKYTPEGTLLYYNDYNTAYPGKLKGILQLLETLRAEGNIDGYGFQMHHRVLEPGMTMLRNAVKAVAATGLKLRVSELDVGVSGNTEAQFKKQAKKYADVMRLMLEYPDQTEAVQVWGLTDNMSYRSYEYPLLFDASCAPKPAFWAVADPEQEIE